MSKNPIIWNPGNADFIFVPTLTESVQVGSNTHLRVQGKVQEKDVVNRNGRIYPGKIWERVLSPTSSFKQSLSQKKVVGQVEHPKDGLTRLTEVSHLVEDVWDEGTDILARILILKTPAGRILEELFSVGVPVGCSSRGNGNVVKNESGNDVVQEDYEMETIDFVWKPSVADAYPGALKESIDSLFSIECKPTVETSMKSLRESLTAISDANTLIETVSVVLSGDNNLKQLLECKEKCDTVLSGLSESVAEAKDDANVAKGKLLQSAAGLKKAIDAKLAKKSTVVESDSTVGKLIQTLTAENKAVKAELASTLSKYTEATTELASVKKTLVETQKKLPSKPVVAKDRAVAVAEEFLARARKYKALAESRQLQLTRSYKLVEALIERGRSLKLFAHLVEQFKAHPSLREHKAELVACNTVAECKVVLAKIVEETKKYVASKIESTPQLKEHAAKFEGCVTVVECDEVIKSVSAKPTNESASPSHIPSQGSAKQENGVEKPVRRGFIHQHASTFLGG